MGKRIELPFRFQPTKQTTAKAVKAVAEAAAPPGVVSPLPDVAELQARLIRQRQKKAAQMRRYRARQKAAKEIKT